MLAPITVGFLLKEQALGAFLAGIIVSGQLLAVFMANSGGAWDNAKKFVEDGNYGGKGTPNHDASVVGDIVGDPLKDTAGPALNPMIKVMNLVGLIMAPLVVEFSGFPPVVVIVIVLGLGAILWSVRRSDREFHLVEDEAGTTAFSADEPAATASPDDFTRLEGIGPKLQAILHAGGVKTYRDLAAMSPEQLTDIIKADNFKAPFDSSSWPEQAELAARGDWDGLQSLQDTLTAGRK